MSLVLLETPKTGFVASGPILYRSAHEIIIHISYSILVKPFLLCRPSDKSVYLKIIFLISQPKHMLWVLNEMVLLSTQNMFKLMGKEINSILGAQTTLVWTYAFMCILLH